jgi:glycosyltransferase involved in cell wall biosynthesis
VGELLAAGAIFLPGRVSDEEARALIGNAAVFVYPSLYEGFGLPPVEALRLGTPVIVGETPAAHEILSGAATYVDPMSVIDIGRAIVTVMNDPDSRVRREAGVRQAAQYTWQRTARLTMEVYSEVAAIARGGRGSAVGSE